MSPVVLMKIWNTYVVPRFLYGFEVQIPQKQIVLLYLLYKRVDSFAPCRIPCAMLILSVRCLSHLTLKILFCLDQVLKCKP
jgi:hypothetical protein